MSDDTSTIRIIGADPERVVSVTVGDLETLLDDGMDVEAGFIGIGTVTIHERTCHFVFRDESCSTPDGYEQDGTYYCSACGCDLPDWMQWHIDDIMAGNVERDIDCCPNCGARVVADDDLAAR